MPNPKKVIVTPKAQNEIDEILANIIEFTGYEVSGFRFHQALFDKLEAISYMPSAMGRLREDGTREAFVNRYRIVIFTSDDIFDLVYSVPFQFQLLMLRASVFFVQKLECLFVDPLIYSKFELQDQ